MISWAFDPDVCFLFWFPISQVREVARRFLSERGQILKEFCIPSTISESYGWMLYLYADLARPYVVDYRTVRNKSRKCGWITQNKTNWYIWIWKGNPGWADYARGSSAPLKTFLRALGSGWTLSPEITIPNSPIEFSSWWTNLSARQGLTLEKWKSLLHIPDNLHDHPRITALLLHKGTGDWFRKTNWLQIYEHQEPQLLQWLKQVENETDIELGWEDKNKVYFLFQWFSNQMNLSQILCGSS